MTTSTASPPARLTRRGRLTVVALLIAAVSGLGSLVGHAATASAGAHVAARHVTVRSGETLWQLALRVAPDADPRVVVAQLEAVNHMTTDDVAAGQRLIVSGLPAA